jgi:hypothetical protein
VSSSGILTEERHRPLCPPTITTMNDQSIYEYVPVQPPSQGPKTLTLKVIIEPDGTPRVEVLEASDNPYEEKGRAR